MTGAGDLKGAVFGRFKTEYKASQVVISNTIKHQ